MREVLAKLAAMSDQERAAFLARTRTAPAAGPEGPTAHERPDGRSVASYGQEQHWFLDQLWSGDAAYLVPFTLRLRGPLRTDALAAAMRTVVERHQVLGATFGFEDGVLQQLTHQGRAFELTVQAVDGATPAGREQAALRYAVAQARAKFDLRTGPLLRTRLLVLGPQDHVLLWIAHHAVADGWSVGVLIEELSAAYRAELAGTAAELPDLPIQFADFAQWQRERLEGPGAAELIGRWRARLAGAPAAAVPTDHPRPPVQTFRGESLDFTLPDSTTAALTTLGRRYGATLYPVLLAALHVLVARHGGEPDAVTGAVLAGRARRETEPLIGPFANTLPLRIDASADPAFPDLLAQVRDTVLDGMTDQELPFGHLVKELGVGRDTSRNPLYQVLFSMGSLPRGSGETQLAPGLTLVPVGLPNGTSRLDLEFTMELTGASLAGRLDYNTDLYERRTAQRLIDQFAVLLAAIAADPELPVSRYPLLAEDEQLRTLAASARPGRPAIRTGFLDLFARQVRDHPDAVAVHCDGRRLTYRQLDTLADRIAHAVLAQTDSPAPVVAVGTGRTIDLLPAIVGILKAGGVYLPLELEYPADRLAYMMADSGAELLITGSEPQPELTALLPATLSVAELGGPEDGPAGSVPARPDLDRLAYVMYTSGSTGRPKGVAVQHHALGNFLASMAELRVMRDGDTTLALASLPFDGSVIELFLPLAVGAAVVVGRRADARDGARLLKLLTDHRVTVLHGTPSTWRLLLDTGADPGLRAALSGGEALPPGLARELRARIPEVWNLYGPAETTVYSLARRLTADDTPLIGRPIAGTTVQVLDERLRPVPPGVLGELHIGGAGLAQGYLNLPELTAARFVTHPVTGERLYRTGDLFRERTDGTLTFHGRVDHQVKLRGHRIEPGEIESVLTRHPAVREAVVLPKTFAEDDRRLVAYVRCGADVTEAELKSAARGLLPEYLMPSRVVLLRDFPLNGSGKVDRKALDALPLTEDDPGERYEAPATPTQAQLATAWHDLLGRSRIGVREDFFTAGGHSLLAVRLLHRVRDEFGVEVPLDAFFAAPTIAGLAELVDTALPPEELADLGRQVAELTDQEVADLLAELLDEH
ncbi:amino acid adenylation domain-containing protein [Kitasatospora sp. GP30]|uniref:non-ribosomal peptide synthetase n=1 Tax=Kitasatospora sp. GP30 TaxID=3035084 RepID=UPI000C70EA7B|nr:non-ribosomal peptide synthetase [Kitasatospora sp. GP30]MDH6139909.1 amino acid adenylation domain-containing protein [Kitasatospora sp. GP30]